jgi:transmembrane sensor
LDDIFVTMTEPGERAIPSRVHDAAGEWLVRRQGSVRPEVEREFNAWLEADPLHRRAYDEAARDWRDSKMLAHSAVGRTRKLGRAPFLMRHSTHVGATSLGLAAILGLVTVGVVREGGPFALVSPAEAATYRTAKGEIRTIRLADGSQVTLDTATLVRVTFTTGSRRLALEHGRARFRVVPDSRRPFVVAVPGGEVVARSTLFDVSVTESPPKVVAIEGTVELRNATSGTEAAPRLLAAGQQSDLGGTSMSKPISPAEARWTSGMLGLDATPLGDAVAAINRYNEVQVRLADQQLSRLSVTGAFRARDPQEFARAIAAMFDLSVDRSSASVIVLAPRHPARFSPPQK